MLIRKLRKPSPDCEVEQELVGDRGAQRLRAELRRKEELRAAGNSRENRPSYETADVAKPTTVVHQDLFFVGW